MLKNVVIKGLSTAQNRSLTLPFRESGTPGPYFVVKATGLDPVKAEISKVTYPEMDRDYFQSSRVGGRNPTFQIALRPRRSMGESAQSLRRALYKVLPPKTPVRITINDDEMAQTYVDGYVESVEPTIFDRNNDMMISIVSMDAYLTSTKVVKNAGYQVNAYTRLNYDGDAPTPFEVVAKITRSTTSWGVRINGASLLNVSTGFSAGDVVTLNTTPGAKSIRRTRGGVTSSLLDYISSGSLDMFIDAASDTFGVVNNLSGTSSSELYQLTYSAKYVGV